MDLTSIFTDDQLGILGCFVALGFCGLMASLSFHVGAAGRKSLEDASTAPSAGSIRPAEQTPETETRRAA